MLLKGSISPYCWCSSLRDSEFKNHLYDEIVDIIKYLYTGGIISLFKIVMFLFFGNFMCVYAGFTHFSPPIRYHLSTSSYLWNPSTNAANSEFSPLEKSGLSLLHSNWEGNALYQDCVLSVHKHEHINLVLFYWLFYELSRITILCKMIMWGMFHKYQAVLFVISNLHGLCLALPFPSFSCTVYMRENLLPIWHPVFRNQWVKLHNSTIFFLHSVMLNLILNTRVYTGQAV